MKNKCFYLIALLLTVSLVSCSKSYVGTYISEKNSKNYMELKSDGSLFVQEGKMGMSGKYEIEDKTITLKFDIGVSVRGKIDKNVIVDDDGENWVKK